MVTGSPRCSGSICSGFQTIQGRCPGHHFQGHSLVLVPAWPRGQGVAPLGNSLRTAVVTMETGQKAAKPVVSDASQGCFRAQGSVVLRARAPPTCWLISAPQWAGRRAPRRCRREIPREPGFGRQPEIPYLVPVLGQASVSPFTMGLLYQCARKKFAASQDSQVIPQLRAAGWMGSQTRALAYPLAPIG